MARRIGGFPGSFNPPTVAHLAIAEAARDQCGLDEVHLVVSRVALGKEDVRHPLLEHRLAVLERVAASRPWLDVDVTDVQLVADIGASYDLLILGADKWAQVLDAAWYGSVDARDAAVAALPARVFVVPRPGTDVDVGAGELLALDADHGHVSSTVARAGRTDLMLPEAAAFDAATGAWTDAARYRALRR